MNVTLLNGALAGDGYTDELATKLAHEYLAEGATVTVWRLRDHKAAYCLGCFECWTNTPGLCRIDDDMRSVAASIIQSDLQVNVSPVTFGGYSSEIKKALDRSICLVLPFFEYIDGEVHHRQRYRRFPRQRIVGILPEPDPAQEELFRRLIARNALNMRAPAHSVEFIYRADSGSGTRSAQSVGVHSVDIAQHEGVPA